jgi:hypothetical protein
MKIIIENTSISLDEDALSFIEKLKASLSQEELEDWVYTWISSVIVPSIVNNHDDFKKTLN